MDPAIEPTARPKALTAIVGIYIEEVQNDEGKTAEYEFKYEFRNVSTFESVGDKTQKKIPDNQTCNPAQKLFDAIATVPGNKAADTFSLKLTMVEMDRGFLEVDDQCIDQTFYWKKGMDMYVKIPWISKDKRDSGFINVTYQWS